MEAIVGEVQLQDQHGTSRLRVSVHLRCRAGDRTDRITACYLSWYSHGREEWPLARRAVHEHHADRVLHRRLLGRYQRPAIQLQSIHHIRDHIHVCRGGLHTAVERVGLRGGVHHLPAPDGAHRAVLPPHHVLVLLPGDHHFHCVLGSLISRGGYGRARTGKAPSTGHRCPSASSPPPPSSSPPFRCAANRIKSCWGRTTTCASRPFGSTSCSRA